MEEQVCSCLEKSYTSTVSVSTPNRARGVDLASAPIFTPVDGCDIHSS